MFFYTFLTNHHISVERAFGSLVYEAILCFEITLNVSETTGNYDQVKVESVPTNSRSSHKSVLSAAN